MTISPYLSKVISYYVANWFIRAHPYTSKSSTIARNCSSADFKILHDIRRQHVRFGQVGRLLQRFVAQPEDVEVDLVPRHQFVVACKPASDRRGSPPTSGRALVAVVGIVAVDEFVQVGAGERVLLEREVHVGAQVVDPQLLWSRRSRCRRGGRRRARWP